MYKALIFDLDGTAIPNKPDGLPSDELVKVIRKLKKNLKICAATGRPLYNSKPILRKLGLTDPCIISGGTQLVDPTTERVLWEKDMDKSQVEEIMAITSKYPYQVFFSDEKTSALGKDKKIKGAERIIYIMSVEKIETEIILEKLAKIPNITAHKVISWSPGCFDIHITHSEATKEYSLHVLLEILGVNKSEVVVAGDSNNDLPLFEIANYKIAMENGSEELKAKADFIAPDINEDGLTIALRKVFSI